jgi:competence protein ComEC
MRMNVRRHSWVYPVICGFFVGIFFESFYSISTFLLGIFLLIAFVLLFVAGRKRIALLFIALFIFGAAFGSVRLELKEQSLPKTAVEKYLNETVSIEGIVADDPDQREGNTKLTIDTESVDGTEEHFRILATVNRYPPFSYGDRVRLKGKLKAPESFTEDGTHIFNYPKYLEKDGILAVTSFGTMELLETGKGNPVLRFLYGIKNTFLQSIHRLLAEPESGLLAGYLVGSKQSLGKDLQDEFRNAGVVHIVVLSGYNITLVATFVFGMFAFLPLLWSTILSAGAMILFVLMVGASGTAVRATLMALLVLLAKMSGRDSDQFRILLIAAFLMVLHNPLILAFDPSFELSFLATLGLILYSPYFEKKLGWVSKRFGIREVVVATLATQVMVLPLLLWMNGIFSIVALPTNLLILGLIPPAMLLGFVGGIIGIISFWAAFPFALLTELILRYQLFIIHFAASIPFATLLLPAFPFTLVVCWYGVYGWFLFRSYKRNRTSVGAVSPLPKSI